MILTSGSLLGRRRADVCGGRLGLASSLTESDVAGSETLIECLTLSTHGETAPFRERVRIKKYERREDVTDATARSWSMEDPKDEGQRHQPNNNMSYTGNKANPHTGRTTSLLNEHQESGPGRCP